MTHSIQKAKQMAKHSVDLVASGDSIHKDYDALLRDYAETVEIMKRSDNTKMYLYYKAMYKEIKRLTNREDHE